jgi:hypothetical protein
MRFKGDMLLVDDLWEIFSYRVTGAKNLERGDGCATTAPAPDRRSRTWILVAGRLTVVATV